MLVDGVQVDGVRALPPAYHLVALDLLPERRVGVDARQRDPPLLRILVEIFRPPNSECEREHRSPAPSPGRQ